MLARVGSISPTSHGEEMLGVVMVFLPRFDWMKRKQVAVTLIRRLADIVTPIGTLVLKGYGGGQDRLLPDELSTSGHFRPSPHL